MTDTSPRDLADRFQQRWLEHNPFAATMYGIPGYDHLLPDESEAGEQAWRAEVGRFGEEAGAITAATPAEAVTLGCVREAGAHEQDGIDMAPAEHTVTAMQFAGPATFLAVAARTVLVDPEAAEAYLARLRGSGTWFGQLGERLRTGAAQGAAAGRPAGRAGHRLGAGRAAGPGARCSPRSPRRAGPARRRGSRSAGRWPTRWCGRRWPGGWRRSGSCCRGPGRPTGPGWSGCRAAQEDYTRAIRIFTTLPRSPEELHQTGLDQVAELEARAVRLGAGLGLSGRDEVFGALRDSAGKISAEEAIRQAVAAVRRAEARAGELFPQPLPPPCEVTPMPEVVAVSGAAPHYTPPRLDGGRAGTFWFNTARPTPGTGWDLEVVAFHEAVPGHHLQLSRLQLLTDLPALQRQRSLSVFSEGWGLYAEQLAEEAGLYDGDRALLGAISSSLMRAARLVVDTGLHAFGWSRERALDYIAEHVPMPREVLAPEIDRYVVMPGQAVSYLTGKLEILRIRDEARQRLGPAFSLPAFHAAVLDHGSLPMPVLARSIADWLDRADGQSAG